jgi:mannose-6-phosphate isomerase-like protein (cupin superfamily)
MSLLREARLLEFPKICDARGNLSFVEGARHVPFPIKRVFYIYDVPGGETRGGHAHKECYEVLIAVSGSLDIRLTDGNSDVTFTLNRSNKALLVPTGTWLTMHNFTTGTVLLALTSHEFEESDYIRDYEEYVSYVNNLPEDHKPILK